MAPDTAVTVIGLAVTRMRAFFAPDSALPPLGGGTDTVHILAGDAVIAPEWVASNDGSCAKCGPYLWVRLVRRWRSGQSQNQTASAAVIGKCNTRRGITIEAGIARCHPYEATPEELEQIALVQLDDSWRIDNALCAAMTDAEAANAATDTGLGPGEPFGPEGLLLLWTQVAYAQL